MQMNANLPDSPLILEAVLEGFVQAAAAEIAAGLVPPYPEPPVRYVEESAGSEVWKLPHQVLADGQGDCEDLCFWEAAGMRVLGEDPTATVKLIKTGPKKLHAIVLRSDGSISDPSARLKALQGRESRHKLLGALPVMNAMGADDLGGDWYGPTGGWVDDEELELGGEPRVIARNGLTPGGKPWTKPVRSPGRIFTPPKVAPVRVDMMTGETLNEQSLRRPPPSLAQFPTDAPPDPYGMSPYYPPGYNPWGYGQYPPGYNNPMMSSPYAYGSPYGYQAQYGFSGDYWGTGDDSPYGMVWGNGPLVTYSDLYGGGMGPMLSPNPIGISEDDVGEFGYYPEDDYE